MLAVGRFKARFKAHLRPRSRSWFKISLLLLCFIGSVIRPYPTNWRRLLETLGFEKRSSMEAAAPAPPPSQNSTPLKERRKKIPTPQDLISHYEAQGMDSKEASVKVIEELQSLVMRVVSRKKSDKSMVNASRKIDGINARMAVVDMKLDSKPGVAQTFAIGVAASAALQGLNAVVPRILDIWKAATSSTGSSSHPP